MDVAQAAFDFLDAAALLYGNALVSEEAAERYDEREVLGLSFAEARKALDALGVRLGVGGAR